MNKYVGAGVSLFVGMLVLLLILFGCSTTVDESTNCVVTSWGAISGVAEAGFHLKAVWDTYHCYPTFGVTYETSGHPDESHADYRDNTVQTQTSDGQTINISYTVKSHPDRLFLIKTYTEVGQDMASVVERVIKYYSRSDVRQEAQQYEASVLYRGGTTELQEALKKMLAPKLAAQYQVLDDFVIRQITFNDDYVSAIEQKQIAFEGIQTSKYRAQSAEQDAVAAVNKAKGEAEADYQRVVRAAAAKADAAQREADAIAAVGKQLKLFPEFVQYTLYQKGNILWGIVPTGTTPLIQIPTAPAAANQSPPAGQ